MANFNTHLAGAALGSGILATFCYNTQLANADHTIVLWVTGALAGLLPDVDSNNSTSLKVIFNTLSMMTAALLVIKMSNHYSLPWIWLSIVITYFLLRWVALPIFRKITTHRGGWHTLLSGLCASMVMTNIAWHINHSTARYAWLLGIFTATGFIIHLVLDEIYSFDLSNLRVKRSFGTAFKAINSHTPVTTCILALFTMIQLWYLPPLSVLAKASHQLANLHILSF